MTIAVMPLIAILPSFENPRGISLRAVTVVGSNGVLAGAGEAPSVGLGDVEKLNGVTDTSVFEPNASNALTVSLMRFAIGAARCPTVPATLPAEVRKAIVQICAVTYETAAIVVVAEFIVHTSQAE